LQISTYWRRGEPVLIDLHPSGELAPLLIRRKHEGDRAMPRTILSEMLPARMASHFAPEDKPLSQWTDAGLRELGRRLQCWEVFPSGTEGFAKAEVTAGGVDTRDLSSQTMEARRVPGLFFIGECVDVTGWLGGYNFQWAWSSAYAASQAV
jgi:predicted flavoprotein YhiN